jgi:hypothetical protein
MRYLLSLTLAALLVAGCATIPQSSRYTLAETSGGPNCRRLAQPGDTRIQIYCSKAQPERPLAASASGETSGDKSCRGLANTPDRKVHTSCGTAAEWEQYDTWAANAGVTCRWEGPRAKGAPQRQELCLTVAQWQRVDANRSQRVAGSGSDWGGNGGGSGSGSPYASSFGAFPAGSAVGGTF